MKLILNNGAELEVSETFVAEHFEEIPEQWKAVVGYEGIYEVSNYGKVRNVKTGRILKLGKSKNGYLRVGLHKNGKQKYFLVHRLVAIAFIPNPDNKETVNHIDEDKTNNHVCNLEWMTQKENTRHSKCKKVLCIETGEVYDSMTEAVENTGVAQSSISTCCNGKLKHAGGFHWCFV